MAGISANLQSHIHPLAWLLPGVPVFGFLSALSSPSSAEARGLSAQVLVRCSFLVTAVCSHSWEWGLLLVLPAPPRCEAAGGGVSRPVGTLSTRQRAWCGACLQMQGHRSLVDTPPHTHTHCHVTTEG